MKRRSGRRRLVVPLVSGLVLSLVSLAAIVIPAGPVTPASATPATDWLSVLNAYRKSAGVQPVSENPSYSAGDVKHARYMVENGVIQHSEDTGNPWYTPEGDDAAHKSNLQTSNAPKNQVDAVDEWMTGPFHAVGLLDPGLSTSGYGEFTDSSAPAVWGAGLNVLAGLGSPPPGQQFPVLWPGSGASTPLTTYDGGESPDPLSSCPGLSVPAGAPIIVQFGQGVSTSVTAASLTEEGSAVPVCVFDAGTYANPDASGQSLGRAVLAQRGAVVMIPSRPLHLLGTHYTASLTVNGATTTWSFVAEPNPPTVTPDPVAFGDQRVGQPSAARTVTWTNQDAHSAAISSVAPAGADAGLFQVTGSTCSGAVAGGAACTVTVVFTPASNGAKQASLVFTDTAGTGSQSVALSGNGVSPITSMAPASIDFGSRPVGAGASPPQTVTVTNTGNADLHVSGAALQGSASADYAISADSCSGRAVPAGHQCALALTFTPAASGSRVASVVVTDDASNGPTHGIDVAGSGVAPALSTDPAVAQFNAPAAGGTTERTVTLQNTGNADLHITSVTITGTNAGDFALSNDCPAALPPDGTCHVDVRLTAPSGGLQGADLVIADDAPGHPHQVHLVGAPAPDRSGYWMLDTAGGVYAFGDASFYGAPGPVPATNIAASPSGNGYWVVDALGAVSGYGDAAVMGGRPPLRANERTTAISATPDGRGYWLFTNTGRVFPFGSAPFLGDMSGIPLNGQVLGSVSTPSGRGYYMVASDGGIFAFGDAAFHGSMGDHHLNGRVVGLAPDPDGSGYWLVATDGGIFAFDAGFHGSMGSSHLNQPVVGMVAYGDGYLMVASDGGIFDFSSKPFRGSLGGTPPRSPVVAVAALDG